MKAQLLKISGHKNEKDFYKEFPTLDAFKAKYGATFKKLMKAQSSNVVFGPQQQNTVPLPMQRPMEDVNNNGIPDYVERPSDNEYTGAGGETKQFGRNIPGAGDPNFGPQNAPKGPPVLGDPGVAQDEPQFDPSSVIKPKQTTEAEKANRKIAADTAITTGMEETAEMAKPKEADFKTGVKLVDAGIKAWQAGKAEKKALKNAQMWKSISDLSLKASRTRDVNERTTISDTASRARKAMMPTMTGEERFPIYGVGTNVLAKHGKGLPTGGLKRSEDYGSKSKPYASVDSGDFAGGGRSYPIPTIQDAGDALRLAGLHGRDDVKAKVYAKYPSLRREYGGYFEGGGEIQNTYAPGDLYDDLGYEPLEESTFQPITDYDIVKAYRAGGLVPKAQSSFDFSSMMGSGGGGASGGGGGGGFNWQGMVSSLGGESGPSYNPQGKELHQQLALKKTYGAPGRRTMFDYGRISDSIRAADAMDAQDQGYIPRAQGGSTGAGFDWSSLMNVSGNSGTAGGGQSGPSSLPSSGGSGGQADMYGGISNKASAMVGSAYGNNAGSQWGSIAGEAVGMIPGIGPIAKAILKPLGTAIGGAFDRKPSRTKKLQKETIANVQTMGMESRLQGALGAYGNAVTEHGGKMTNPRVIKYFGEHDVDDLFVQDPMMDTLRGGGHMRRNQVGDIEAISGGHLQPMSYNPYDDGSGITSMIKGQSHNESNGRHTGVLMRYSKAQDGSNEPQVEAENNEPIKEIGDDAVIFGDIVINDKTVLADPQFKHFYGKTFKKAMEGIAKEDAKLNKKQAKNTEALQELDPKTPFDKLKLNSLAMNEKGINARYKINNTLTKKAAEYQEIFNNVAEERGLNPGALSRGKVKPSINQGVAQYGRNLVKAQGSAVVKAHSKGKWDYIPAGKTGDPRWDNPIRYDQEWAPSVRTALADPDRADKMLKYMENISGPGSQEIKDALAAQPTKLGKLALLEKQGTNREVGPMHYVLDASMAATEKGKTEEKPKDVPVEEEEEKIYDVPKYKKSAWEDLAGHIMPWIRKQPGEDLLGDQLAGEMFALSHNQVEPVQARFYNPDLDVPYDISYQDRLNENQATFNSIKRAAGADPEALAMLAGQKYAADSNVLAEQFRANQAKKDQVYSQNRATLNQAQQANLGIADQQYVRQTQARANTKETIQEALNSVSAKIGQNRLENRTLQTYANMFPDYSYDKNYRITKTGLPVDIDIPVVYNEKGEPTHVRVLDEDGKTVTFRPLVPGEAKKGKKKIVEEDDEALDIPSGATPTYVQTTKKKQRYGGLVKAFKNF